jgi:hypothetical protein
MTDENLWLNANGVFRQTGIADPTGRGVWGVCVGVADGLTAAACILRTPYSGDLIQAAQLGDLRALGFDFVHTWEPRADSTHGVLLLNEAPPPDQGWRGWELWDRLRVPFGPEQRITRN